jgi:hypothetical protein
MVQDLAYVQMRESGFSGHYKTVLCAGAKAKTVTNNLPLSVLAVGLFITITSELCAGKVYYNSVLRYIVLILSLFGYKIGIRGLYFRYDCQSDL